MVEARVINSGCPFCGSMLLINDELIWCSLQGKDNKSCTFELDISRKIPPGPPEPPRPNGYNPKG